MSPIITLSVSGDEAGIRELVSHARNNGTYEARVWFINHNNVANVQKIEIVRIGR